MSENYQVLARKYRPQAFQEVIGQEETVKILKNSIRLGRLAQAYLFSGSRGIGKTTLARLFAKALNCSDLSENTEPCNKCSSCLEITGSCSLDVLEIDGASNRGIDDIRQINETIGYAPSSGKYKIYIIDEVHMLTKEAFNALLKTLEEPPPAIKFFFATTEPHKVPPTILSRCQRFDLVRISYEKIVHKLKLILKDLNREAEEKALHLIARFSDGSLRDSQSFLDQLLCYESNTITESVVSKILGLIPQDYFFKLDEAIQSGHEEFAYELSETIYTLGKDFTHFTQELLEHFRRYLMLKYNKKVLELDTDILKKYQEKASFYKKEELLEIIELLLTSLGKIQKSLSKKTAVEMFLLQTIRCRKKISAPLLVQRLIELEKSIRNQSHLENSNNSKSAAPIDLSDQTKLASKFQEKSVPDKTEKLTQAPFNPDLTNPANNSAKIDNPQENTGTIDKSNHKIQNTIQNTPQNTKPNHSHHNLTNNNKLDTFLQFTAVELDGIAKKE